jgi:polyhydroxyalkanoate synthesis regulator phasin
MTVENMAAEEQPTERPPLAELARKMLLASIGAVALVQEEAEVFIHKLIEKGEITEKDGVGILKDFREKRKKKAEEELDKRISSLIERMNVPTKSDINALSEKIAELAEKLDKK